MRRRWLAVVRLWAAFSVLLLVPLWSHLPSSPRRWAFLLLVGAPLCALVALGGGWVFFRLRASPRPLLARLLSLVVLPFLCVIYFVIMRWVLKQVG